MMVESLRNCRRRTCRRGQDHHGLNRGHRQDQSQRGCQDRRKKEDRRREVEVMHPIQEWKWIGSKLLDQMDALSNSRRCEDQSDCHARQLRRQLWANPHSWAISQQAVAFIMGAIATTTDNISVSEFRPGKQHQHNDGR